MGGSTLKSSTVVGRAHVVDLQNHLDNLSGQQNLLLLAVQRLDHVLFLHVYNNNNKKGIPTSASQIRFTLLTRIVSSPPLPTHMWHAYQCEPTLIAQSANGSECNCCSVSFAPSSVTQSTRAWINARSSLVQATIRDLPAGMDTDRFQSNCFTEVSFEHELIAKYQQDVESIPSSSLDTTV